MPRWSNVAPLSLYHHNVHFVWSAATFEGRSAVALQYARKLREIEAGRGDYDKAVALLEEAVQIQDKAWVRSDVALNASRF